MSPEDKINALEQELTETRTQAARMTAELAASLAPEQLEAVARSFDRWAEHPDVSDLSSRLASLFAAAVRAEDR